MKPSNGAKLVWWLRRDGIGRPKGFVARFHAMLYVTCPEDLGNRTIREVAIMLGMSERAFRHHVQSYERTFGAMGRRLLAVKRDRKGGQQGVDAAPNHGYPLRGVAGSDRSRGGVENSAKSAWQEPEEEQETSWSKAAGP